MCKYCDFSQENCDDELHSKPKHIKEKEYDIDIVLRENDNRSFHLQINDKIISREINYCPICGRKLTIFDNPDLE